MSDDHQEAQPPRDPLGRAHQLRVDIAITITLVPAWVRRALVDRNPDKVRSARAELVERIAASIERRFRLTWIGSHDDDENARAPERSARLFGDPAAPDASDKSPPPGSNPIDSSRQSDGT